MIEKDLFSTLKNVCDRVYPIILPEGTTYPAITYQVIFDGANQAFNSGNYMSRDVRFQIDIFSKSYSEAKTLKEQVIHEVIGLNAGDITSQDIYEDELSLYRQIIDIKIRRS